MPDGICLNPMLFLVGAGLVGFIAFVVGRYMCVAPDNLNKGSGR